MTSWAYLVDFLGGFPGFFELLWGEQLSADPAHWAWKSAHRIQNMFASYLSILINLIDWERSGT